MLLPELLKNPKSHWGLAAFLFALTIVGSWEMTKWEGLNQWLGNTAPEFLGAAIITLIVGAYLRDSAKRAYVKAMRSVRAEFRARAEEGGLGEGAIQQSMITVVVAISRLHFGPKEPPVGAYAHLTGARATCVTCKSQTEKVQKGRCGRCKDIVESWSDEGNYPVE